MTTNYHRGMNGDDQALAELSSIAAGWLKDGDLHIYRVGCEACEWFTQEAVTPDAIKAARDPYFEAMVTARVWEAVRHSDPGHNCPHLRKYEFWKSNPKVREGVQMLGLLIHLREHPPEERP